MFVFHRSQKHRSDSNAKFQIVKKLHKKKKKSSVYDLRRSHLIAGNRVRPRPKDEKQ